MRRAQVGRIVLATIVAGAGLLGSAASGRADEDDDRLRVRLRGLECYAEQSKTIGFLLVQFDGPNGHDLQSALSLVGYPGQGAAPVPIQYGLVGGGDWPTETRLPLAKLIYFLDHPAPLSSVRAGLGGVDTGTAQAAHDVADADCQRVGSERGQRVRFHFYCVPSRNGYLAATYMPVVNHSDEPMTVQSHWELSGREGERGEFSSLGFGDGGAQLQARSTSLQGFTSENPNRQYDKIRVEMEMQLSTRDDPIRETEESDCRGDG